METVTDTLTLKHLDKSTWKTYRFDQIAKNVNERVDPTQTDLDVYVGLEHLDSESIHIKRTGKRDDVSGTKLRFYPGDVIFGRRRAYQRKAAVTTCDGFCSAHALVLRAKPDVIDPRLFPFFLHSDAFMHRAVDISVGSLSPTINWGTLKKEEFLLPPPDQQARLAELLWAADEVVERDKKVLNKTEVALEIRLKNYFEFPATISSKRQSQYVKTEIGWMPANYQLVQQKEVVDFINGRAYKKQEWEESGVPVIRLQNLTGTGENFYYSNLKLPEKNYCEDGDLLYMWSATFGAVIWRGDRAIFHYHIWNVKCKEDRIRQQFMYYNLEEITRRMMRQVSGSTMPHITKEGMEKLKIGLPPIEVQDEIVLVLDKISGAISLMKLKITNSMELRRALINQIF
ncbi:type I restriction enzyme, S subunit [Catalinimonas alkaloidigena]|uniref:Type I restriction enzyme, S subunit n=1 Tax=Catalinimonas alkaloidigena TaxID=1075417 RepID=A0A1G9QJD3_9BACT|nr:restriction endonuclease subunit S [Catalinimonas alkaloidigena]SDM11093.1 type I restriction enzyme, S subunit [Catalinimonas alkaloidigena]